MADQKTEAEWAKSKRIEAERMKAAKHLAEEQNDQTNLAYLDPKLIKTKGWSSDKNVILASVERAGNLVAILAVAGIVLGIIGSVGAVVSTTSKLGLASVFITSIPDYLSFACFAIAIVMGLTVIISEIIHKIRQKRKFGSAFWSAVVALALIGVYELIHWLIIFG